MFPLPCYFLMNWYTGHFPKCPYSQEQIDSIEMTAEPNIDLSTLSDMIRDCLVSSLIAKGVKYWQHLCELQHARKDAEEYKIKTAKFTTPYEFHDESNQLHLEHLYTAKNVIISLFDLKPKIVPEDALNIYPDDFHTWIDNTGAIELSVWINRSKPLIYKSMKKAKLDETHPFWSIHKRPSNRIACKPRTAIYKELLAWKTTIPIHAENAPFIDKHTRYSPSPPPRSFTLCIIPDFFLSPSS